MQSTKDILSSAWRVFRRRSEKLFVREMEVFDSKLMRAVPLNQGAIDGLIEQAVERLFENTIRHQFRDLAEIAVNYQLYEPIEWARKHTEVFVRDLLENLQKQDRGRELFAGEFQRPYLIRLDWLVDEAHVALAKSPVAPRQSLPNYGKLRRKIAEILEKYGVELSSAEVRTKLDSQAMDIVPDKSFKLPNGEQCMTFSQACKNPKLSKKLHDNISTVRTALRKTRGPSQK